MPTFVEAEGLVHLVSPVSGGELTLCGDAFDMASEEEGYEWRATKSRTVTCESCTAIVLECRGVRVAKSN